MYIYKYATGQDKTNYMFMDVFYDVTLYFKSIHFLLYARLYLVYNNQKI